MIEPQLFFILQIRKLTVSEACAAPLPQQPSMTETGGGLLLHNIYAIQQVFFFSPIFKGKSNTNSRKILETRKIIFVFCVFFFQVFYVHEYTYLWHTCIFLLTIKIHFLNIKNVHIYQRLLNLLVLIFKGCILFHCSNVLRFMPSFSFEGREDCLQSSTLCTYKSFCSLNSLFRPESRNYCR